MAKFKLNEPFRKAAKRMTEKGKLSPAQKWEFDRHMQPQHWLLMVWEILPEFGINPAKYGQDEELTAQMDAAFKRHNEVWSDGWTLESSNCGKHHAAEGFSLSTEEKEKVVKEVFV